jgi:hypothetical protein
LPSLAVLHQRFDVLERGRLERLEPVPLINVAHDADDVFTAAEIVGKKIAGAAGRFVDCRSAILSRLA